MTDLGVKIPPLMAKVPRAYAILASVIWLVVALPFCYLAYVYWDWPQSLFSQWRGWVFALAGLGCIAIATIVPPRYRVAILGTKLRAWARLA
jgi:hypothetical protein